MKMLDLDNIETAARKAGGREWYCEGITLSGLVLVHDCIGGSQMIPIEAATFEAQFIEAANPAAVLELIRLVRSQRDAIKNIDPASCVTGAS